jgi:hypothetical protein
MHNRCIVMTTTERVRMNVRRASIALALVVVAAASACGSSGGTTTVTESRAGGGSNSKVLVGAGSTFVAPLVQQWEADYVKSPAATAESGRVLTRDQLRQRVWGVPQRKRDRSVDVCVRKLRSKIDLRSPTHIYIHTHPGVGYRFDPVPR